MALKGMRCCIWFYLCTKFDVPIRCVSVFRCCHCCCSYCCLGLFYIGSSFKAEDNANKKFTNSPSCQYKFIETIITTEKYTTEDIHTLTQQTHSVAAGLILKTKAKAVVVRINNRSNFLTQWHWFTDRIDISIHCQHEGATKLLSDKMVAKMKRQKKE